MVAFQKAYRQINYPRQQIAFYPYDESSNIKLILVRPKRYKELPI